MKVKGKKNQNSREGEGKTAESSISSKFMNEGALNGYSQSIPMFFSKLHWIEGLHQKLSQVTVEHVRHQ